MTMTELHLLPIPGYNWSRAYGINDAGQIVGETGPGYGVYAVRWDGIEPTVLDTLSGATGNRAAGINKDGYVVGYTAISNGPFPENNSLLSILWAPNVCGDGIRKGNEWCDDGNTVNGDGCESDCTITPETTGATNVLAGGVATTFGTNTDATPADPVETSVTSPTAGTVSITETTPSTDSGGFEFAPPGYAPIGQQVNISAPAATPQSPLKIEFSIDLSQIPGGDYSVVQVSRAENGGEPIVVPPCIQAPPEEPLLDTNGDGTLDAHDPCAFRELIPSTDPANDPDDVKFTVFTTHASMWVTSVPLTTCGNGIVEAGEQCDAGAQNGSSTSCCSASCTALVGKSCEDGNACTGSSQCNAAGVCVGSDPVSCGQSDTCHEPKICNPATGVCGGGTVELDADADGTPDCSDGCPTDGTKASPGFCGCGIPDTWSDLLQPINADGSSIFKLGSTVPVKFALTGDCAQAIKGSLVAKLYLAKLTDSVLGTEVEATSTSAADAGNTFRYDSKAGQYIFNLGSKSLLTGTWQLRIDLGDGVARTKQISFKK
jgi:cysteine-rich repeat protein